MFFTLHGRQCGSTWSARQGKDRRDIYKAPTRGSKHNKSDVNGVLPRKVAQAVNGSNDTRFYGVGSGDVGKELPRNKSVVCVLLGASLPKAPQETFPACMCMFVPRIYLRVNHCCTRCPP